MLVWLEEVQQIPSTLVQLLIETETVAQPPTNVAPCAFGSLLRETAGTVSGRGDRPWSISTTTTGKPEDFCPPEIAITWVLPTPNFAPSMNCNCDELWQCPCKPRGPCVNWGSAGRAWNASRSFAKWCATQAAYTGPSAAFPWYRPSNRARPETKHHDSSWLPQPVENKPLSTKSSRPLLQPAARQ
jgi:hypothetical protein